MPEIVYMPLGENIRQMRRKQSLTQTELGGEHFSKSYVSAVERNKIAPSYEAMHFFAEQMGQPVDYFEKLFIQNENAKYIISAIPDTSLYTGEKQMIEEKLLPLLESLLDGAELYTLPLLQDFLPLTPDAIARFSTDVQGRYAFLIGLIAQHKQDFVVALFSLERSLPLAPRRYRPAILDALGTNYYYQHAHYTALDYHKRALLDLEELEERHGSGDDPGESASALHLKIEFNCGNDYYAMGAHHEALAHFERARKQLRSTHNIKTAAQLYLKLGYCIYADVYHRTALTWMTEKSDAEIEREFQRAVSYFVQSRTLFQVSSDRLGEANARLSQAMVLLDLCTHRRKIAVAKSHLTGKMPLISCATLLDEAEEQCRQVLLSWEPTTTYPTPDVEIFLYTALAYLVRVTTQRAVIARLGDYVETAIRECAVAAHLCQQVLDTFSEQSFPWRTIQSVTGSKESVFVPLTPSLPQIREDVLGAASFVRHEAPCSVVLFAAGEVAEMIGSTATEVAYAEACHERANQCFQAALHAYGKLFLTKKYDASFLYRTYLRCIETLEERKQIRPETAEKTNSLLLKFLKDALQTLYILAL